MFARKCQCREIRSADKWPRQAAPCEAVSEPENTDLVQVRRAYKFRAFPTRPQEGRAVRLLADHCDLCNAALMERRELGSCPLATHMRPTCERLYIWRSLTRYR